MSSDSEQPAAAMPPDGDAPQPFSGQASTGAQPPDQSPGPGSVDPGGDAGSEAGPRIRIGSQRPVEREAPKPKPFTPVESNSPPPPPVEKKYPPPNIRTQLSPDLELELAEALGNVSLDEMLAGGAQGPSDAELEPESKVSGRVIKIHRDLVFFDLGGRRQGALSVRTFPGDLPAVGAVLEVMVSRFDAGEGLYELNLPGAAASVADWSEVAEGMVVEARVTGHNKGGLECEVNHLRGFIPAGQISLYRVEDFAQFVGQKFACVITEANPERRNLVLSRRGVLEREQAEAKEKLLAQLEVGQTRDGIVRSLQNFGAFVDLGGVDGLIHISQLSWDRLNHASEALEVGQKVKVRIQKIDAATGKIGLAFRDLLENPWQHAAAKYPARSHVQGTVSKLMEFGAFVRLEPGIEGLIHISELAHRRVHRASDIVSEGQEVEVLILSVDPEQQRISLSLKALEARPEPAKKAEPEVEEPISPPPPTKERKTPLKGGIGRDAGGQQFGLKW